MPPELPEVGMMAESQDCASGGIYGENGELILCRE